MIFKSLFGGKSNVISPTKLPQLNSVIDVVIAGKATRSVIVESVGPKGIVTQGALGQRGDSVVMVYQTPAGRFRLQTKVAASFSDSTQFELPKRTDLIGASSGAQKRQSVRLDVLVSGQWRFAPGGGGTGEFKRTTLRDISRGGASLIVDRELKHGTMVEIRMQLQSGAPAVTLLGEVMRHQVVPTSGKHNHGLRFHGVRPEEDQAIIEFMNRKQADLRNRGLA